VRVVNSVRVVKSVQVVKSSNRQIVKFQGLPFALRAALLVCLVSGIASSARAQAAPPFRWAGDAEGGEPYVQANPDHPETLEGFEVDIADLLASRLGRQPQFIQIEFKSIDQSIARGDADIGMSGIEDTPARRSAMAVTVPYYRFREVLAVRTGDARRYRTLADLGGRRVATLGGTMAFEILLKAQADHGVIPVSYDDDVHPYEDLVNGRVDGVLLDDVLAFKRTRRLAGLTVQPDSVTVGHYVGVLAKEHAELRDRCSEILKQAMQDGRLERIFRKWSVWNDDQPALYRQVLAGERIDPVIGLDTTGAVSTLSRWEAARRYLPSLLRASVMTIALSCLSMALAVLLGIVVASGRVYGPAVVRAALTGYVEVIRGTPILLQLFVLYYGLAAAVRLPAFVAAFLGLALNYAAYESEIYRSALEAIGRGQLEAARTLGFSELQILRLIRGPQAFRLALAPMTNDFVALLKDSSLVSVLTVVELTKQTQIFATNLGSWVVPGALCAGLYLAMSLPLSALARRLEDRWKQATS
jgi:polar amino acid transport system substrate-binding protein